MTRVADIMSSPVRSIGPEESLRRAAAMMREFDIGALPVCHEQRLLGIVTDRDLVVRGIANGLTPDGGCVSDVMTAAVAGCSPDQDVAEVLRTMSDRQLRRLPVIDGNERLVGMLALADVALCAGRAPHNEQAEEQVGETVRCISQPAAQGMLL